MSKPLTEYDEIYKRCLSCAKTLRAALASRGLMQCEPCLHERALIPFYAAMPIPRNEWYQ